MAVRFDNADWQPHIECPKCDYIYDESPEDEAARWNRRPDVERLKGLLVEANELIGPAPSCWEMRDETADIEDFRERLASAFSDLGADDGPEGKGWLVFSHKWSGNDGYASWYRDNGVGYTPSSLAAGRYSESEAKRHECAGVTEAVEIGGERFKALLKKWAWWELRAWDELAALHAEADADKKLLDKYLQANNLAVAENAALRAALKQAEK